MKQTFEQFLMDKHAEDYISTKDCMVDDFGEWLSSLSPDELIEYGNKFAKEQSKGLLEVCKKILRTDYCSTGGDEMLRQAIAKAEETK